MLRDLQDGFREAVLTGNDAAAAPFIAEGKGHRIGVHQANTQLSLADTLAAAYPAVQAAIGADAFRRLAFRAIAAQPPAQPHLLAYGGHLAMVIETRGNPDWPHFLADLARLEWARLESYSAADASPMDATALTTIPADQIERVRFTPHPAIRLIHARCAVLDVWRDLLDNRAVPDEIGGQQSVLVSRSREGVAFSTLAGGAATFTTLLMNGRSLGEAAATAGSEDRSFDLQTALAGHLADGTFVSFSVDASAS